MVSVVRSKEITSHQLTGAFAFLGEQQICRRSEKLQGRFLSSLLIMVLAKQIVNLLAFIFDNLNVVMGTRVEAIVS